MARLSAIVVAGCLALAAPSAFAIPFGVGIVGGGAGSWTLSGPTSLQDDWTVVYSKVFDIAPGSYSWAIDGSGVVGAAWAITLNDQVIHRDSVAGLFFKINDNFTYEVTGPVVGVPAPGTLALLGLGLVGLALSMRRKFSRGGARPVLQA